MIVDELIAILGYETKGEGELKRFQRSIDDTAKRITLFAAAAATAAAGALAVLGKSVITTSAQFESYAATLETIEGSAEKAQKALDWVSVFGQKTPYEVGEVTEAFVRLKSYGIDPTTGALESIGDASSAMGKTLMQGVEAIADAATGEFERLKEFGITTQVAGDKVTFNWTKNSKTLSKTVKKNSAEIIQFLKDNFADRFNGAMLRQSKTWNGMMSNLGDSWTNFLRKVGDAGFFDAVKGQLGRLLDFVGRLSEDGSLDRWAKRLSDVFIWATNAAANFANKVITHFQAISGWIDRNQGIFDGLKYAIIALGAVIFPKTFALLVLEDVLTYLEGGDSVIGDIAKAIAELVGADPETAGKGLAAIAAAAAGLLLAAGPISIITGSIRGLSVALAGLSAGEAAAGAAVLMRVAGLGAAGIAGLVGLLSAGKQHIMSDPDEAAKATPEANHARTKARGEAIRGWFSSWFDGSRNEVPETMAQKISNAQGNFGKMSGGAPANAVVNDNKQDNRNQSVTVQVGGVTVQGVQSVTPAVGAAVGSAVGQAAAGGARASRFEKDDAF